MLRIESPFLIVHAEDDGRVQFSQAEAMHKQMRRNDKSSKPVTMDMGGHSLMNEAARQTLLVEVENFLDQHIGER